MREVYVRADAASSAKCGELNANAKLRLLRAPTILEIPEDSGEPYQAQARIYWGFWLVRWMNLPEKLAILLATGTAICGGSAIVATAPVIEAEEKDVAISVAVVSLLGLFGTFVMPFIGQILGLSSKAGLGAIHQTPKR